VVLNLEKYKKPYIYTLKFESPWKKTEINREGLIILCQKGRLKLEGR